MKVLAGDNTTTADPSDRLAVSRAYPHTFGQPLVHLLPGDAKASKRAPLRYCTSGHLEVSWTVSMFFL